MLTESFTLQYINTKIWYAYKFGDLTHIIGELTHNTGELPHVFGELIDICSELTHNIGELPHVFGELIGICSELTHIIGELTQIFVELLPNSSELNKVIYCTQERAFGIFLQESVGHHKHENVKKVKPVRIRMPWRTTDNVTDCGIFA